MASDVLVTYAGSDESILEAAEIVARELAAARERVDVSPVQEVDDLERYSAVVLGSPIRNRALLPEAVEFVHRHQEALALIAVAYFLTSPRFSRSDEENRSLAKRYLGSLRRVAPKVKPLAVGSFARLDHRGLVVPSRVTRQRRWLPESALHDWWAVRNWAATLDVVLAMNSPRARGQ